MINSIITHITNGQWFTQKKISYDTEEFFRESNDMFLYIWRTIASYQRFLTNYYKHLLNWVNTHNGT